MPVVGRAHDPGQTQHVQCIRSGDLQILQMTKLRVLFLLLECSNWRVHRDPNYAPNFNKEDQEPVEARCPWLKKGEVKEAFINRAMDEALARSIWKTINQKKTGRPLERLTLWPTGVVEYGTSTRLSPTFAAIVQHLARSWLIERVPRNDREKEYTVSELRQGRRLAVDEKEAKFAARSRSQDLGFWEVFCSIWPSKAESRDFRDDWSSFTL